MSTGTLPFSGAFQKGARAQQVVTSSQLEPQVSSYFTVTVRSKTPLACTDASAKGDR